MPRKMAKVPGRAGRLSNEAIVNHHRAGAALMSLANWKGSICSLRRHVEIDGTAIGDGHDLMHKSWGWMPQEVGKRNQSLVEELLRRYHRFMS
jgi:3-methyladenine DNA glycosylase AlkD